MPPKSAKRPTSVTAPKAPSPHARRIAFGTAVARIVLVAALAVGASVWGLVRHFTHPFQPMLVPAGSTALSAPEIEVTFDPIPPISSVPPSSTPPSSTSLSPSGSR